MKNHHFIAIILAGIAAAGCNSNRDSKTYADSINTAKDSLHSKANYNDYVISGPDAKFAVAAYNGSMAEVELGQLAQEKGTSAAIKEFGAMMVKDHSKAKDELKKVADAHKVKLPASVSTEMQELKKKLSEKTGAEFDKAYAEAMVKDHEEDIELFTQAQNILTYQDLMALNKSTLPVLTHHLEMIKKIKEGLK
jgi:putative membrane protein